MLLPLDHDYDDYFDSGRNGYFPDIDYLLYYNADDYFLYPKTSTSTTSTTECLLRLLPLLPLQRLLPPRPGDLVLSGVQPEDLLSTRVHPKPSPTYLCPIFYNMPTIFIIIISSCCIAFCGFG